MPRHRPIQIRFIRKGAPDPSRDDILKVTKVGENSMRIVYTEKNVHDEFTDYLHVSYAQFIAYIYRTILLLTLDEDPFQSVQLFVPAYPTVLLSVGALKENTGYILEMLTNTMSNWPVASRFNEPDGIISSHTIPVRSPEETTDAANDRDGAEST